MCQVQMRENSLREIAEWERDKRLRNRAIELAEKLPGAESVTAERMVAELMDGGFGDTDKWRQLGDAMERKYMGYLERDQAMAESDVAEYDANLQKMITRVQVEVTTEMARHGYGAQKIEQFRNASSAGAVAMQEVSCGAAKDLKTKGLPMLDSEIKRLRAKETALTKQGKALSKTDAHNLKRFEAAREVYGRQIKALSDVGEGKADFTAWDDIIRSATGGRDITEFCKDLGDFMSTIK